MMFLFPDGVYALDGGESDHRRLPYMKMDTPQYGNHRHDVGNKRLHE